VPLMQHVIAKNLVAAGVADEILVQVSYAIGG
jgi:S-adenosylmethionine synthetase